jgi:protein-disulfide isomerase
MSRHRRLLAAAFLAAAVVAVAIIASSSGGGSPPPRAATSDLFRGIPERAGVLGDPDAPVTVTEYLDLQCPACAAYARESLPDLVQRVHNGQVKLEARTLHFLGPDSERAARFAAGAAEQGRLWPFLEAFYAAQGPENSGYVTDEFLRSVSAAAGVDADAAFEYADGAGAQDALNRANADAERFGVQSTPSFTVARGERVPQQVVDAGSLAAAIEAAR